MQVLRALTGWQRLLVFLSAAWALFVATSAAWEGVNTALHGWLNIYAVGETDPLGIFPQLVFGRLAAAVLVPIVLLWLVAASLAWVMHGFAVRSAAPLVRPGRLQDVLALIQVLALDEHAHRSADGLDAELQRPPRSAASWRALATEHPEFFRLHEGAQHELALVARHVLPRDEKGKRDLSAELVGRLLGLAVELHDRQLKRANWWEVLIPLLVAVIAGVVSLIGIALKS